MTTTRWFVVFAAALPAAAQTPDAATALTHTFKKGETAKFSVTGDLELVEVGNKIRLGSTFSLTCLDIGDKGPTLKATWTVEELAIDGEATDLSQVPPPVEVHLDKAGRITDMVQEGSDPLGMFTKLAALWLALPTPDGGMKAGAKWEHKLPEKMESVLAGTMTKYECKGEATLDGSKALHVRFDFLGPETDGDPIKAAGSFYLDPTSHELLKEVIEIETISVQNVTFTGSLTVTPVKQPEKP